MTTIDFSELIPERLRINNLPDGSSLELIHRSELGPEELAEVYSVQKRINALQREIAEVDELDDEMLADIQRMSDLSGEMLQVLAPELTAETLASLKMGQRGAIITWWAEQHQGSENGNAAPKAPARRSRSSKRRG